MAKKGQNKLAKWFIIPVVIVLLFALFAFLKNKIPLTTTPLSGKLTKEEAIAKVKTLPEVKEYLKRVPNGLVAVNGEEDNTYMVQVYEFKDGHTATLNWYKIDKATGEVKKEF